MPPTSVYVAAATGPAREMLSCRDFAERANDELRSCLAITRRRRPAHIPPPVYRGFVKKFTSPPGPARPRGTQPDAKAIRDHQVQYFQGLSRTGSLDLPGGQTYTGA